MLATGFPLRSHLLVPVLVLVLVLVRVTRIDHEDEHGHDNEGVLLTGKVTLPDRARFHAIARGSAMECGALVDVAGILGLANESEKRDAKDLVVRIVSMLSTMRRYER